MAGGAAVLALSMVLTACGSTGGSAGGAGSGSGGASDGVVSQSGQGARLTGTYSALDVWGWLPNNLYPSNITEVPQGAFNTNSLVKVNAKYDPGSESCGTALETMGGPGYGEEAYLIDQGQDTSKGEFYAYAVYEFASASQASGLVKAMAAKVAGCGSFTVSTDNGSLPAVLGIGPSSEAQVPAANTAVDIRESVTDPNGKKAVGDVLLAADGNMVLVESASGTATIPAEVSLTKVAQEELAAIAKGEAADVAGHVPSDYTTSTAAPVAPSVAAERIGGGS
jgi:hypothetical protein